MKNTTLVLRLSLVAVVAAMIAGCGDSGSSSGDNHHSSGIAFNNTPIVLTNGVSTSSALRADSNSIGASGQDNIHSSQTINVSYNDDPVTLSYHELVVEFPKPLKIGTCTPQSGPDGQAFKHCDSYQVSFKPTNVDQDISDTLNLQYGGNTTSIKVGGSVPVRLFENSIPDIDATLDSYTLTLSSIDAKNHLKFNIDNLDLNNMQDSNSSHLVASLDKDAVDVDVTTKDVLGGMFSHFGYNPGDAASTWSYTSKAGDKESIHADYNSVRSFEITTDKGNVYNEDLFSATAPTLVEIRDPMQSISDIVGNKSIQNFVMNRSGLSVAVTHYWYQKTTMNAYAVTTDAVTPDAKGYKWYDLFGTGSHAAFGNNEKVLATNMFHIKDPDPADDDMSILYTATLVEDTSSASPSLLLHMHTSDLGLSSVKAKTDYDITLSLPAGAALPQKDTEDTVMAISNNQTYDNPSLARSSKSENDLNILLYIDGAVYQGQIPKVVSQNPTMSIQLSSVGDKFSNAVVYREHTYHANNTSSPKTLEPETTHQAQYLLTISSAGAVNIYDPNNPETAGLVHGVKQGLIPLSFSCSDQSVNNDSPLAPACYLAAKDGNNLDVYKFSDFTGTKMPLGAMTADFDEIENMADVKQAVIDGDTGSMAVLDSTASKVDIYNAADSYKTGHTVSLGGESATGVYDY
jgi:hypothetical protein